MKEFTDSDVDKRGSVGYGHIFTSGYGDLVLDELPWQKAGLSWTASGYGAKIASSYKIHFGGRLYRLYHTIYSNSGSVWFVSKGRKIFVS